MRYHVDWTKQFVIVTDASGYACGYALMQVDDNGHSQIVRTGSKTLNETQQRYSTTEKEAYGLVYAVEDCKHYVRGQSFIVKTDHRSLTFFDTRTPRNDKCARWLNFLNQFDFLVVYLQGSLNCLADYFSRKDEGLTKLSDPEGHNIPAGEFIELGRFRVYRPSWVDMDKAPELKMSADDLTTSEDVGADNFVALVTHGRPKDIEINTRCSIASAQFDDPLIKLVIDSLLQENRPKPNDKGDEELKWLLIRWNKLSLDETTSALFVD